MSTVYEVHRHKFVPQMGVDEHVDTGFRICARDDREMWEKVDAIARRHGCDNAERWFYPVITTTVRGA